ncbi:MAG: carboxylesterase/lipase family protein [Myxococcota bacterium]
MPPTISRLAPFLLFAALACGGSDEAPALEPDPASERALSTGRVVGFENGDGAHVWRGLPFAKPPVGELRWRAPRKPEPWEGVRDANVFGAECPQFSTGLDGGEEGERLGSEDCLVANVFAPSFEPDRVPQGDAKLPVMVWIHGGGNSICSAEIYDLGRLALSQGVVAVGVHYRLGVLGWFRHPSLHGPDDTADDRSGNYGTLDLVRALEWVQHEIEAFGGDPDNVTVFGESAGGVNVFSLLLSPRAAGLFHRGIAQSGILATRTRAEAEHYADAADPGHERSSREIALALWQAQNGLERSAARAEIAAAKPAEIEALLRGSSADEIYALFADTRLGGMVDAPYVLRDGHVIPDTDPLEVFALGRANDVPVIFGSNRDENKLFMLFTDEAVTRWFGFPMWLSDARRWDLLTGYMSRLWKVSGVDAPARAMAGGGGESPVWAYRFDWDEQPRVLFADFSKLLGAAHAMEMPFMLGHLDLGRANRFLFDEDRKPAAESLSKAMMSYWGRFAHAGDPGRGAEGSLPEWRPWSAAPEPGPGFLVLDTEADGGIRMSGDTLTLDALVAGLERDARFESERERCEVFAQFTEWSPYFTAERYQSVAGGACAEFEIASFPNPRE